MILKDMLFGAIATVIVMSVIIAIASLTSRVTVDRGAIITIYTRWGWIWGYAMLWSVIMAGGDVCWSHWLGEKADVLFTIPGFNSFMSSSIFMIEIAALHILYLWILNERHYLDSPMETAAIRATTLIVSATFFVLLSFWYGEIAYITLIPMILSTALSAWVDHTYHKAEERGKTIAIDVALRQLLDVGYMVTACLVGYAIWR